MFLTRPLFNKAASGKKIMVVLKSLSGTGHKVIRIREKGGDKMEEILYDPWVKENVLYRELKKIRTLRKR